MKKTATLFLLFIGLAFAASAQVKITTIDSARINDVNGIPVDSGTQIQVTGVVYGPNAYPTSRGRVFMLQGATLGIKVYSKDTFGYVVADGDTVTVVGTLSTYKGQAEIDLDNSVSGDTIIKYGNGPINAPVVVSIVGEANESSLTELDNINMSQVVGWTLPHAKHSFNVHVGSVYFFIDSFMSPDLWNLPAAPTGTYNIVGFGSQFDPSYPYSTGYSLQPRSLADFHFLTAVKNVGGDLSATVYPNPASSKLNVTFTNDNEHTYTAKITDMTGRVVIAETGAVVTGENNLSINTTDLNSGIYVLELHTGEKALVTKVSIAK